MKEDLPKSAAAPLELIARERCPIRTQKGAAFRGVGVGTRIRGSAGLHGFGGNGDFRMLLLGKD